jgi:hypothetical protein
MTTREAKKEIVRSIRRMTRGDLWGEERRESAMPCLTLGDFIGEAMHQIERFKRGHAEIEGISDKSFGRLVFKSGRRMTFAEWWAVLTERHLHLDLLRLRELGEAAIERESNKKSK